MTWLLTGGAGYIGAHVLRELISSGRDVVVVDDLSTGLARKVPADVPLHRVDVCDRAALSRILVEHQVTGVVHLAAKKAVDQSIEQPLYYYRQNVDGAVALAEAARDAGVRRIVYSSSAAVYGAPERVPVFEDDATVPTSPYGETKLIGEWVFRDAAVAHGLAVVALRYFNVAGAGSDDLGDTGVFNLLPLTLRAVASGVAPRVYGDDYPTPDGTCIRDYVHVADLAEAHIAAVDALESGQDGFRAVNIGRGTGDSVLQVIAAVGRATRRTIQADRVARRAGDQPVVVASAQRALSELGWAARRDLDDMTASAWSAWQANPPRD
jgi:UDP-glucose 4-epimerase